MKKTKVITKLIAIILSILVVVQVAPMSTFAETIGTEGERFEESGYSTEVSQEEEDPIVNRRRCRPSRQQQHQVF